MTLPKRPIINNPIPNETIADAPEQYTMRGPYWDVLVGGGLDVNSDGELTCPTGLGSGSDAAVLAGTWWPMGIGEGLTVNGDGQLAFISSP